MTDKRAGIRLALRVTTAIVWCGFSIVHAQDSGRTFTVRDSIELPRAVNFGGAEYTVNAAGGAALYSPEKSRFVLRTCRGDLQRNVTIESLLFYDTDKITSYLSSSRAVEVPSARTVVRFDIYEDWARPSEPTWINEEELAYIAKGNNGKAQLFIVNAITGETSQVTHAATHVLAYALTDSEAVYYAEAESVSPQALVADQSSINDLLFESTDKMAPAVELFQLSRRTGTVQRLNVPAARLYKPFHKIWVSPSASYAVVFTPAVSAPVIWAEYKIPGYDLFGYLPEKARSDPMSRDLLFRAQYQLLDLKANTSRRLLNAPSGFLANDTPPEVFWSSDEQQLIVSSTFLPLDGFAADSEEGERRRSGPAIAEIDLGSGRLTPVFWEPTRSGGGAVLSEQPHEIAAIEWDDRKNAITIDTRTPHGLARTIVQKTRGRWAQRSGLPSRAIGVPDISRRETINERPKIYATGGACRCSRLLLDPAPHADNFTFGHQELIQWRDANGLSWRGGLMRPPNMQKGRLYPLVVQVHGFKADEFLIDGPRGVTTAKAAQPLANAGFLVLSIENPREALTFDERESELFVEGYRAGIDKVIREGLADPSNVGMIAHSRAGLYLIPLLAKHPELLKAVDLSDGFWWGYFVDLLMTNTPVDIAAQVRKATGGSPTQNAVMPWMSRNPLYRLNGGRTAIRLETMGKASALSSWEQFVVFRRLGHPVELMYYPEGSHVLKKPRERLASQGGNVDWFRFWLQEVEDSDPDKVEQYARWRAMRAQLNSKTKDQLPARTAE